MNCDKALLRFETVVNRGSACLSSPRRDRAWGRYFGRHGAARVLHEGERPMRNDERRARWAADYYGLGIHRTPERIYRTK